MLVEVTVDSTGAEGVLYKQGAAHGGHVLFVQDGRLHYIYNFLGEEEQGLSSPEGGSVGRPRFGVAFRPNGHRRGTHTPLGDAALYIDGAEVAAKSGVRSIRVALASPAAA